MDGYQFTASLVGSLAWPAVVGVLLFLVRKQIVGLAVRLKELSLPGGMKATFEKELEAGRNIAEALPAPPAPQIAPPPDEHERLLRVAIEAPDGAVVLAYMDLEKILKEIAEKLGKPGRITNHPAVVRELVTS